MTFVAKLRCEWAKVCEPWDGKNVLATSRSPNAGWLALHFWPRRKKNSFHHVTGILGQIQPLLSRSPIQQISTCWKVASTKGCNQPIWKDPPPKPSLHIFHCTLRRCSLADCRRLTDPPNSSGCPFYAPCSLVFLFRYISQNTAEKKYNTRRRHIKCQHSKACL